MSPLLFICKDDHWTFGAIASLTIEDYQVACQSQIKDEGQNSRTKLPQMKAAPGKATVGLKILGMKFNQAVIWKP